MMSSVPNYKMFLAKNVPNCKMFSVENVPNCKMLGYIHTRFMLIWSERLFLLFLHIATITTIATEYIPL
jgi:hypothetical protein